MLRSRAHPVAGRRWRIAGLVVVALLLAAVPLGACDSTSHPVALAASIPSTSMVLAAESGAMAGDNTATGQRALKIWSTASATGSVKTVTTVRIDIRARGDQCQGPPVMSVRVDGIVVGRSRVSNSTWSTFSYSHHLRAGEHEVTVDFTNDHASGSCDRNLWLDWVHLDKIATGDAVSSAVVPAAITPSSASPASPTPTPSASTAPDADPFAGATLFVDPHSDAAVSAATASDPTVAALLAKVAGQPQADWFSGDAPNLTATVDARVTQISKAGALPVLVAYAIPLRDCGTGYSKGGVADSTAYHSWISQFAAGIGERPAVVVLEPDALAQLDCLTPLEQAARIAMLQDAIRVLTASPQTYVYLDAGNRAWHDPSVMAARLEQVGLASVRGFSLNVSGFDDTTSEEIYGEFIAGLTGKHYIVDVSRNARGSGDGTCNPAGRGLGQRPTVISSAPHEDALLWVKRPGESDGACAAGDPPAGVWSTALAEGLASRANW